MTGSEVSQVVEGEVAGDWSISNAHGVDLRRCLVAPEKGMYADAGDLNRSIELWLVLEEVPDEKSGYKIVFDEDNGMFGLAIRGKDLGADVFLGYYGTFLETLEAM